MTDPMTDADLDSTIEPVVRDWITSVTGDWTAQAELRRRVLDIRYRIDHKELDR